MTVLRMMKRLPMLDFNLYVSPKAEQSFFKGIPVQYLEEVRIRMKAARINYRFRFRGPRATNPLDLRNKYQKQSYVTKELAKTFAVYIYGR
jgi:hypothetical protein